MTAPEPVRYYQSNVLTFTADGTWYKPHNLVSIVVYLQGAGGGGRPSGAGTPYAGGGGGATVISPRLFAAVLPEQVPVTVGASAVGQPGGPSTFGDINAPGGQPGTADGGGMGGVSPWRGGMGGATGDGGPGRGESVSHQPIGNLAGGGGGGINVLGSGLSGGDYRTASGALLWPGWFQAGRGGKTDEAGETPGGGGGMNASGGAGMVTVIETLLIEEG